MPKGFDRIGTPTDSRDSNLTEEDLRRIAYTLRPDAWVLDSQKRTPALNFLRGGKSTGRHGRWTELARHIGIDSGTLSQSVQRLIGIQPTVDPRAHDKLLQILEYIETHPRDSRSAASTTQGDTPPALTDRQEQIGRLLRQGLKYKRVADKLGIDESVVRADVYTAGGRRRLLRRPKVSKQELRVDASALAGERMNLIIKGLIGSEVNIPLVLITNKGYQTSEFSGMPEDSLPEARRLETAVVRVIIPSPHDDQVRKNEGGLPIRKIQQKLEEALKRGIELLGVTVDEKSVFQQVLNNTPIKRIRVEITEGKISRKKRQKIRIYEYPPQKKWTERQS